MPPNIYWSIVVLVVILVVTISHISRDENVYSRCEKPLNIPWTHRRMSSDEMELVITVSDVDDNPPVFSRQMYTVAVVRGTPPPTTLINLAVSDINSEMYLFYCLLPVCSRAYS